MWTKAAGGGRHAATHFPRAVRTMRTLPRGMQLLAGCGRDADDTTLPRMRPYLPGGYVVRPSSPPRGTPTTRHDKYAMAETTPRHTRRAQCAPHFAQDADDMPHAGDNTPRNEPSSLARDTVDMRNAHDTSRSKQTNVTLRATSPMRTPPRTTDETSGSRRHALCGQDVTERPPPATHLYADTPRDAAHTSGYGHNREMRTNGTPPCQDAGSGRPLTQLRHPAIRLTRPAMQTPSRAGDEADESGGGVEGRRERRQAGRGRREGWQRSERASGARKADERKGGTEEEGGWKRENKGGRQGEGEEAERKDEGASGGTGGKEAGRAEVDIEGMQEERGGAAQDGWRGGTRMGSRAERKDPEDRDEAGSGKAVSYRAQMDGRRADDGTATCGGGGGVDGDADCDDLGVVVGAALLKLAHWRPAPTILFLSTDIWHRPSSASIDLRDTGPAKQHYTHQLNVMRTKSPDRNLVDILFTAACTTGALIRSVSFELALQPAAVLRLGSTKLPTFPPARIESLYMQQTSRQ
ncbi:hypothetical protein C8J57DRAFT_1222268 [Mycena rebaudengoi]|nr:hypothetical protein C8J57DRAFT_1222268 [Mycena rebaudengoi]